MGKLKPKAHSTSTAVKKANNLNTTRTQTRVKKAPPPTSPPPETIKACPRPRPAGKAIEQAAHKKTVNAPTYDTEQETMAAEILTQMTSCAQVIAVAGNCSPINENNDGSNAMSGEKLNVEELDDQEESDGVEVIDDEDTTFFSRYAAEKERGMLARHASN